MKANGRREESVRNERNWTRAEACNFDNDGWLQDKSHDVTRKSGLGFVTRPGSTVVSFKDGDDSSSGWNTATEGGSASADGSEGARHGRR